MPKHSKHHDKLPKTAPKRTGKSGIGPVDEPEKLKTPRQTRLPTMEDAELSDLEDAAREYANVLDDRMHLTRSETDMKDKLLALMKKHSKITYRHDDVEIRVVHTDETVKVKILKDKDK